MKKLFSVMAIVALVSCNSGEGEEAAATIDSSAIEVVAPAVEVPAVVDTAAMVKDTAAVAK